MRATGVIGANFGDEGKGLLTDYFCAEKENTVAVRFNGGAQAGHTVVTNDGKRFVFKHFGSGTLAGSATFLSRFFISNPLLWYKEKQHLLAIKESLPLMMVDPDSPVTTPLDMLVNQIAERARGDGRHGSCGIGINETIVRNQNEKFAIRVRDLEDTHVLFAKMEIIKNEYLYSRLEALNVEIPPWLPEYIKNNSFFIDDFVWTASQYYRSSKICGIKEAAEGNNFVFEGAQGLLLDQDHRYFPHVTRSKTGLHNIAILMREAEISGIDLVYVTRAYMTRHGAGPFETEDKDLIFEDWTNVSNEFQGSLRFGHLDVPLLAESIKTDLKHGKDIDVSPLVAITCLDQFGEDVALIRSIQEKCGIDNHLTSSGPTRDHVENHAFYLFQD